MDLAKDALIKAALNYQNNANKLGIANANKELGRLYQAYDDNDAARKYLTEAHQLFRQMNEISQADKIQSELTTYPKYCHKTSML